MKERADLIELLCRAVSNLLQEYVPTISSSKSSNLHGPKTGGLAMYIKANHQNKYILLKLS